MRVYEDDMDNKKLISVIVPCYNEGINVKNMGETLVSILDKTGYLFEILFVDNCSTDDSKEYLYELILKDKRIKALINNRNYGVGGRKGRECFSSVKGDVVISIACDFQEPPERIPEFIEWWEKGYKVVCGQKIGSKEGNFKYGLRQIFYKIINGLSDIPQYANISGITLLDREVVNEYLKIDDDIDLRFALADMGYEIKLIQYEQQNRKYGKSSYNIWRYLSFAINSMVNTSTAPLRLMTVAGFLLSLISFIIGAVYLIMKLIWWNRFPMGTAPILIALFFIGSVQLLFMGIIGEYIGVVLRKVTRQPDLIVRERINFDDDDKEQNR